MTLNEGDMIITGTPAGVGPIEDKDELYGTVKDGDKTLAELRFSVNKEPLPEMQHFSKL